MEKMIYTEDNKPLVKNSLNAKYFPKKGEINTLPSLTVPDQTMSVQEIFNRYSRGLSVATKEGVYNGEVDFPDLERLDLSERMELLEAARQNVERIQRNIIYEQEKKKDEALQRPEKFKDQELPFTETETKDDITGPEEAQEYPKKTRGSGQSPEKKRERKRPEED